VAAFGISGFELSGSGTRDLVLEVFYCIALHGEAYINSIYDLDSYTSSLQRLDG
jgi:hypothetical protein